MYFIANTHQNRGENRGVEKGLGVLPTVINKHTIPTIRSSFRKEATNNLHALLTLYIIELRDDDAAVHTIRNRAYTLRKFINHLEENGICTIQEIERYHLKAYLSGQINSGHLMTSVNTTRRFVKWFLCWILEDNPTLLNFDPRGIKELKDKPEPDKNFDPLTPDVIYEVVSSMSNLQDQLMTSLIFEGALRISELVDMRVERVNFDEIRVYGKGNKLAPVYIPPDLAMVLQQWIEDHGYTSGYVFRPDPRFSDQDHYSVGTVRDRVQRWFDAAGIDIWMHLFRHSFAIDKVQRGADIRSVQMMLRHEDISTTMRYLKFSDHYIREQRQKYHHNKPITITRKSLSLLS